MATSPERPPGVVALIVAIAAQGLSGVAGGLGLVMDPTGSALQIPSAWLEGSPFDSYFVPGLVLLTVLGLAPLVDVVGLWRGARWGWHGAVVVGGALIVWLVVEILVIGYQPEPPLQAIYGVLGAVIVGLALLPSVRQHFQIH